MQCVSRRAGERQWGGPALALHCGFGWARTRGRGRRSDRQGLDRGLGALFGGGLDLERVPIFLLPLPACGEREGCPAVAFRARARHFRVCLKYLKSGGAWSLLAGISIPSPLRK